MRTRGLLALLLFVVAGVFAQPGPATAATSDFRGVNWADQRDNFVDGVLYVSGLSSADTYASASATATQVVSQMYAISGANTLRLPINEPTVASYWSTYTGAIDAALSRGKVILAYWAHAGGKPAKAAAFNQMWDTVVAKYGGNANAYFEVINEPYGYSTTDLNTMYNGWLARYPSVPRGRVILDGSGYATGVSSVGADTRLNGTLLAVHYYSFFTNPPHENETAWFDGMGSLIGSYASRTVATEWGGAMSPGTLNGVWYDAVDYSIPSGSFWADYLRGVSAKLRQLGVGSVYWPGLRDGDFYSLTSRSGTGSATRLALTNASGLTRLQYAWGIGTGGGTYTRIRNVSTGLAADGLGRTGNGSDAGQYAEGGSTNQQWVIENDGAYVRIRNRATGLYLDGMGRTANGSAAGQYAASGSPNQQWTVVTAASNVRVRNRATGLFLDGMGRTGSGSVLAQYGDSGSATQQWKIVAAG